MPGLLEKLSSLTDSQLAEGIEHLADADRDDLLFFREAMLMETERRQGTLADEKSREYVRDELGRFAGSGASGTPGDDGSGARAGQNRHGIEGEPGLVLEAGRVPEEDRRELENIQRVELGRVGRNG